ncbi:MAG: hypothetical protein M3Z66_00475 [Chloroflexota bacterium]|nr:hypothetical protein [Chloroflexota bacterium]
MMRHSTVRALLASRPDLPPREQQRLERHLSDCDECRMIGQEYRRQQAVLRQYRLRPAPVSARSLAPARPERHIWNALDQLDRSISAEPAKASARRFHTKLYAAFTLVVTGAVLLATGAIMAGPARDSITDLGKVTNSIPQPPTPLTGRFHRTGPVLTQHGKPELLFIGSMVNGTGHGGAPASERWALVKALNQFGNFTGVTAAVMNRCDAVSFSAQPYQCSPVNKDPYRGYPTFDLSHARFTSRYVILVAKDVIDQHLHVQTNLSPLEQSLVERYIGKYSNNISGKWADLAWLMSSTPPANHGLPLVSIGGYLQTDYGQALVADLTPTTSLGAAPFSTVQDSLRKGKAMGSLPSSLIFDFNSETNVLTALICHATKNQPKNVCTRPTIKTILKHVK